MIDPVNQIVLLLHAYLHMCIHASSHFLFAFFSHQASPQVNDDVNGSSNFQLENLSTQLVPGQGFGVFVTVLRDTIFGSCTTLHRQPHVFVLQNVSRQVLCLPRLGFPGLCP